MAYDVAKLLKMSRAEIDKCFAESPPGPIPNGEAEGTAIVDPGTAGSPEIAKLISLSPGRGRSLTRRTRRSSITSLSNSRVE